MGSEISKKDITRLGFRSSLLQASFNYEKDAGGRFYFHDVADPEKDLYVRQTGLSAAMKDNLEFINTHSNLVGFPDGRY